MSGCPLEKMSEARQREPVKGERVLSLQTQAVSCGRGESLLGSCNSSEFRLSHEREEDSPA